jgi:hypothetical protein
LNADAQVRVDKQVQRLIEKMLNRRTEQKAFSDLEALGCLAVPAIIARMDDRRSLPDPSIALRNKSPDAFEWKRFYGPSQVVDALAAILNQITGQDFGSIYNGASEAERTSTVRGWRNFLEQTPLAKLCEGGLRHPEPVSVSALITFRDGSPPLRGRSAGVPLEC